MKKNRLALILFLAVLAVVMLFFTSQDIKNSDSNKENDDKTQIDESVISERPEIDNTLPKTDIFAKLPNSNLYRVTSSVEDAYFKVIVDTLLIKEDGIEFYLPLAPEGLEWFGIANEKYPTRENGDYFNPLRVEHEFVQGKTNTINFNRSETEYISVTFSFDGARSNTRALSIDILPDGELQIYD